MFSIIKEKIRKNKEKKMEKEYKENIAKLNKLNYKDYLLQGKRVKLKSNLLSTNAILFSIAAKVKVDENRTITDIPVIIGEFGEFINTGYILGCWDAISGDLLYFTSPGDNSINSSKHISKYLASYYNLRYHEIVEVEDLTDEYLNSINQYSLNLMYLWLGNVYGSKADSQYQGRLALNLKEE